MPDSAALAAVAGAAGGRLVRAGAAGVATGLPIQRLTRARTESLRLWESPWVFAVVVAALSAGWIWRRRRGLP